MNMHISLFKPDMADRRWFIRFWEIFPGAITWLALLFPAVLSLLVPVALAYFIIAFDLYWMVKSFRLSYFLLRGYNQLRRAQAVDWSARLLELKDIEAAVRRLEHRLNAFLADHPGADRWLIGGRLRPDYEKRQKYLQLYEHYQDLEDILEHKNVVLDPDEIYHAVILAVYNEGPEILEPSVRALTEVEYAPQRLMLIIAYEARGGEATERNACELISRYGSRFAYAAAIKHPDGLPGEIRGKGANITFAGRQLAAKVAEMEIDPAKVVVTTLDADHRTSPSYFTYLSYAYAINPNRVRRSFQPIPMFFNNIWDVPAPMRVIATGNSFWMIMETMRPHRLRNFAAHAQSLQTLIDTDFWSVTSIVEDGHQYWRTFYTYDGDHQVVPLFTPIYQDAVLAGTYYKTFKAQYLQLRRWAWGASDIAYVARQNLKNRRVPWIDKLIQFWRLFEGHFSWATAPLILSFAAWLPLVFNRQFSEQLLAHQLPIIASRILSIATVALFVTVYISMISLPPRPPRYSRSKLLGMLAQWVLLPLTAIVFSAFAAIDAQTRLMLGRYMGFRVTEKARKT